MTDTTPKKDWQNKGKIVATYSYEDERGKLLYQCCRIEPGHGPNTKRFVQRRPQEGGNGWIYNLDDTDRVLYRLPELMDEKRKAEPVYVVEGEKDVETLRAIGLLATTCCSGAMSWDMAYGRTLRERRVIIIPDNDEPGHRHAVQVAGSLVFFGAKKLAIVHLPVQIEGGDVTDWLASFTTKEAKISALRDAVSKAAKWERS